MKVKEFGVKKLSVNEKEVKLTDQEIIKFGYITKEIIGLSWGAKLTNAQANCYVECFYSIQNLLEKVDKEYVKKHAELFEFFREGKRMTTDDDRLRWEANTCGQV